MGSYPVEIKRCQHIKTSGAQCGSPALKGEKYCYYHEQNRTVPANIYLEGERDPDDQIMIPPLEDAHAVQMVVRHVIQLMMERRIDRKDASLMLYALQIASGNLKQMQAEKPRPTQVVMDPEKVEETPLGMTPWSAKGEGHDVEDEVGGQDGSEDSQAEDGANAGDDSMLEYNPKYRYLTSAAEQLSEMFDWVTKVRESNFEELRGRVEGWVLKWLEDSKARQSTIDCVTQARAAASGSSID